MQLAYTRADIKKLGEEGKKQRFHFVGRRRFDGEPLFEKTALMRVRSLSSVGGSRADAKHTKRANKKARKLGYPSHAAFAEAMARHAIKMLSPGRV